MSHITAAAAVLGLTRLGLALTSPAHAASEKRTSFDNTGTLAVNDLCPFPVAVTAHALGTQTIVDSGHGSILRAHVTEVDSSRPTGTALTGTPHMWQLQVTSDADANVVQASQTGMNVRGGAPRRHDVPGLRSR